MKRQTILQLAILAALVLTINPAFAGRIIYVDDDVTGVKDGSSWANAYKYLQDALAAAYSGDEIRVAQGIYKPDQGTNQTPGDRTATFQLKNGVTIKGGFAGFGEPDPNVRDFEFYETILSGDLDGNDVEVNDPFDLLTEPTRGENSYHVVTGSETDATAVLDSFTITAGNADGPYPYGWRGGGMFSESGSPTLTQCTFSGNSSGYGGGGMYNDESSPTLVNCTFSNNSADDYGGGMYNKNSSSPTLTNCTFSNNLTDFDGGGMYNEDYCNPTLTNCMVSGNSAVSGGGMYNKNSSSPTLTNCTFNENLALSRSPFQSKGGGMYNYKSNPNLINCNFNRNSSHRNGGGMFNCGYSGPTFTNCIFNGNSSDYQGGGIYITFSSPTLTNCTFSDNSADYQGGGIFIERDCYLRLTNCIMWQDTPQEVYDHFINTLDITYSNIQDGWLGLGNNIDVDPCFVDAGIGDYHLQEGSPCINTGDPNYIAEPNETDLDGRPRIIGGRIDMGAYEFQRGPRDLYVDADAAGANNGSSWADAFNYLQDALTAASRGDEIWVAQGIYKPDQGTGITPGDREDTFQLINGVTLKGGYAGFGEPDPNARNIELYETILSGDLNGDDIEIAGHINLLDEPTRSENSYRVVTANGNDRLTALDGFIITAGNANGIHSMHYGGGMNINNAYVQVTHCTFTTNSARLGGGIFTSRGSPTIRNNTIRGNLAEAGGAIKCSGAPNITHNIIADNNAIDGAGIWVYEEGIIANNIITKNTATRSGGGIFLIEDSTPMIINNVISENWAEQKGGGIGTEGNDLFTLIGNLIVGNGTAGKGGGIHLDVGGGKTHK